MRSSFINRDLETYGDNWTPTETVIQSSILVYVLLVVTALQLRSALLWSESRILRKVRALQERKTDEDIVKDAYGTKTNDRERTREEIFSRLYISLSKGRHRRTGRLYSLLYLLFFYSVDIIDTLPSGRVEFFSETEVIISFRISLYWGSLTVLGARQFSRRESFVAALLCALYGFSILLTYIFNFRVTGIVRSILVGVRFCVVVLSIFYEVRAAWSHSKSRSLHISSIANAIRENDGILSPQQQKHFDNMRIALQEDDARREQCKPLRGERGGEYWPVSSRQGLVEVFVLLTLILTNGIVWSAPLTIEVPQLLAVEVFELFSTILFFVNDYQVEPRLFLELLRLTEVSYTGGADYIV